jgi:hypothetical protein
MADPLTIAYVEDFRREGYVVVRGFYAAAERVNIMTGVDEAQKWPETPGK